MITSVANARIKNIMQLKKSARHRRQQGCFLVEGPRMVFEIPMKDLRELYVTVDFLSRYESRLAGRPYELISDQVCRHICDTRTPQGILAVAKSSNPSLREILQREKRPLLLILEDLQDPGNLGTIIRTGEGAGVTAVIISSRSVDPYNPKVVRSTMGSIFRVPVLVREDILSLTRELQAGGIPVYAAHLEGRLFYEHDYRDGCAFLIGNEGNGLSPALAAEAGRRIRIPMKGKVESLNAAMASGVILYEVQRQRNWQ